MNSFKNLLWIRGRGANWSHKFGATKEKISVFSLCKLSCFLRKKSFIFIKLHKEGIKITGEKFFIR